KKDCSSPPIDIDAFGKINNDSITADLGVNCVNDIVKLENIYYDYDKYAIRKDASTVLDKLAVFLKSNSDMSIELRSHTDCRGTDSYNMVLSQRRAKSAVDYLIRKGVQSQHLTAKGFGESMPLNPCSCEGTLNLCTD